MKFQKDFSSIHKQEVYDHYKIKLCVDHTYIVKSNFLNKLLILHEVLLRCKKQYLMIFN